MPIRYDENDSCCANASRCFENEWPSSSLLVKRVFGVCDPVPGRVMASPASHSSTSSSARAIRHYTSTTAWRSDTWMLGTRFYSGMVASRNERCARMESVVVYPSIIYMIEYTICMRARYQITGETKNPWWIAHFGIFLCPMQELSSIRTHHRLHAWTPLAIFHDVARSCQGW